MAAAALPVQPAATANSKGGRFYRPELDVLRCIAFLMVFTSHILTTPDPSRVLSLAEEAGAAGVCVFFTLSAYLITELLLRERETTGVIHRAAFYLRRILRIWPLYFTAVAVSILCAFVYHRWTAHAHFVLPYMLLSGNLAVSVLGRYPRNGLLAPLWSISVEEQFYLLWPLLLWWRGRRAAVIAALLLLPVAWANDLLLPALGISRDPGLWTSSLSQFQFFAIGALLAVAFHRRPVQFGYYRRISLAAVACICFFIASQPLHFLFPNGAPRPGHMLAAYLLLDIACGSLLLSILGARMPAWTNPLRHLGKISYGLYVIHYTIWIGIGAAVTRLLHRAEAPLLPLLYVLVLSITIALAELSYRYLETPFLRIKNRLAYIPTRSV